MSYALLIAAAVALAAIYKFLPNKRFFPYFCAICLIVFIAAVAIHERSSNEEVKITPAQIEKIHSQQKIFADWYAEYQKDIDTLAGNWRRYHGLIENFKAEGEDPDIGDFYDQMSELEKDVLDEQLKVHMVEVPKGLDDKISGRVSGLIKKMQTYADAQTKTVTMTKESAYPVAKNNPEVLKKKINEIMIRESPAGLFIAEEVAAVRAELTLPEEFEKEAAK